MTHTINKSTQVTKPINGNAAKFLAYREAWTRIKQAQEQGFYLEAITIEESIISDRLNSYFKKVLKPDKQPNSLKGTIDLWRKYHPEPIMIGDYNDLIASLDEWRSDRNQSIHAIVQSETHADRSIGLFLSDSQKVAFEGEKLTLAVSQWCDRCIKKANNTSTCSDNMSFR